MAAGETLTSIAAKYGVQAADIRTANNLRRNAVRVGQVLTINGVDPEIAASSRKEAEKLVATVTSETQAPAQTQAQTRQTAKQKKETAAASKTTKATASKKQTAAASKKQKATTHTIKSGENLGRIAKKYGVTVEAIKKANGMKTDAIRAGKELKIPAKK
ncbi:MAG: LysM peptidoglycan-binding domain-containing protein [Muribaculaceae bacterium]|nr:LysM peptidoglycan-binding domain-containing protein [Muribaculaceae bacterium]